jgi:hypothetical protein
MQPDVFLKLFGRLNLLKWAAGCSVQSVGLLRPAWRAGFLLLVVAVFCCIAGWLSSRMIASQRRSLAVVCWHASSCGLCYRVVSIMAALCSIYGHHVAVVLDAFYVVLFWVIQLVPC